MQARISTSAHANAAASATLANSPIRLNPSTPKASTVPFGLTKSRAISFPLGWRRWKRLRLDCRRVGEAKRKGLGETALPRLHPADVFATSVADR